MPTLYVMAGPNGAGKTTLPDCCLPEEANQLEFVNADLIADDFSPNAADLAAIEAGKVALKRMWELIARKADFTWQSTMRARIAVGWLGNARQAACRLTRNRRNTPTY